MTREEQIKKQADIYTDDASNYAEWSDDGWSDTNDIDLVEKAFIEGAKWADSHPSNVWHDASDIPNDDSLIIYESVYGDILLKRFTNRASAMANVLRWAYIDTILPKTII